MPFWRSKEQGAVKNKAQTELYPSDFVYQLHLGIGHFPFQCVGYFKVCVIIRALFQYAVHEGCYNRYTFAGVIHCHLQIDFGQYFFQSIWALR